MQAYFDALNGLTWFDGGTGTGFFTLVGFLIGFAMLLYAAPFTLVGVIMKLKGNKKDVTKDTNVEKVGNGLPERKLEDTNTVQEKSIARSFIDRPLVSFAMLVISIGMLYTVNLWEDHVIAKKEEVTQIKTEMVTAVFTDYLTNYDGSVHQPKDMIMPKTMSTNSVYETSMTIGGVKLNNQLIYVMYSDKYEADTLIPFDASAYPELIPSDKQRQYYDAGNLNKELKSGLVFMYSRLNTPFNTYTHAHIDNIDFIYNIQVYK